MKYKRNEVEETLMREIANQVGEDWYNIEVDFIQKMEGLKRLSKSQKKLLKEVYKVLDIDLKISTRELFSRINRNKIISERYKYISNFNRSLKILSELGYFSYKLEPINFQGTVKEGTFLWTEKGHDAVKYLLFAK